MKGPWLKDGVTIVTSGLRMLQIEGLDENWVPRFRRVADDVSSAGSEHIRYLPARGQSATATTGRSSWKRVEPLIRGM
jgi:hypothetical protein